MQYPNSVAVGDFNRDGQADLAVAVGRPGLVSLLLGTGSGSFGAQATFEVGSWPASVAVADFNGDGLPDLAVANKEDGTVSVLLNQCGASSASGPGDGGPSGSDGGCGSCAGGCPGSDLCDGGCAEGLLCCPWNGGGPTWSGNRCVAPTDGGVCPNLCVI